MRISDWSSDVCSSDLRSQHRFLGYLVFAPTQAGGRSRPGALCLDRIHGRCGTCASGVDIRTWRDDGSFRHRAGSLWRGCLIGNMFRSEEHTSELQLLMRISYDGFCLKKKKTTPKTKT